LIPVPGTAIGKAVKLGTQMFVDEESDHKAIVLITDGEDHGGEALEAAEFARQKGVRVYAIGIGTQKGNMIPQRDERNRVRFKKDLYGNVVVTRLDEKALQEITQHTGGVYYRSRKGNLEIEQLYKDLRGLGRQKTGTGWVVEYDPLYRYLVIPALLLLTLEMALSERRRGT